MLPVRRRPRSFSSMRRRRAWWAVCPQPEREERSGRTMLPSGPLSQFAIASPGLQTSENLPKTLSRIFHVLDNLLRHEIRQAACPRRIDVGTAHCADAVDRTCNLSEVIRSEVDFLSRTDPGGQAGSALRKRALQCCRR